jgi:signal transduction histidine kinase
MKGAKLHLGRRKARMLPSTDAIVKAQLAKTSRELAHESSDLSTAVESLNKIIKANRRAAAKSRTRLLSGLALGAALMYHLDSEHGRERRAATARMLTDMVRGEREPHSPAM